MSYEYNQNLKNLNDFNLNDYHINNIDYTNNNFSNFNSIENNLSPNPPINQFQFFTEKKSFYNNNDTDSFQKMKEEKFEEIRKTQKNNRFNQIYSKKIKNNINTINNVNQNNPQEEIFIDDYIKLIKEIRQDRYNYLNYIGQRGYYNFSICPFCGEPVVYILERVLCINKCFRTTVPDGSFDKNYTLDNFMEQYKEYYSKHFNCRDNLITLYIDNDSKCAEFICNKCEKPNILG